MLLYVWFNEIKYINMVRARLVSSQDKLLLLAFMIYNLDQNILEFSRGVYIYVFNLRGREKSSVTKSSNLIES